MGIYDKLQCLSNYDYIEFTDEALLAINLALFDANTMRSRKSMIPDLLLARKVSQITNISSFLKAIKLIKPWFYAINELITSGQELLDWYIQ